MIWFSYDISRIGKPTKTAKIRGCQGEGRMGSYCFKSAVFPFEMVKMFGTRQQ